MKFVKSRFVIIMTILAAGFYFAIPAIGNAVVSHPTFSKYAVKDANFIVKYLQGILIYPFGKWISGNWRYLIMIPYYFLLFMIIRYLLVRYKKFWKGMGIGLVILLMILYIFPGLMRLFENAQASTSHGTAANGSIENAKRMYFRGDNFTTYSFPGYLAGRTFLHDQLRKAVKEAYAACETSCPGITFVLGETGLRKGGQFLPHRTHRNGLSVDFMSPLLRKGRSYKTHHLFNLWGYALEFDNKGKKGNLEIDYETMARHLHEMEKAAKQNGLTIRKVIFDPVLRPYLLASPSGEKIRHLPFTKNRVTIRHDDHYHIDFALR